MRAFRPRFVNKHSNIGMTLSQVASTAGRSNKEHGIGENRIASGCTI
jgi:hypothetical protein